MSNNINNLPLFYSWPKIKRLDSCMGIIVTEKIDGTNAVIHIAEDGNITAGNRNKWLLDTDNYDFKKWVECNQDTIRLILKPGYTYGEWYGKGINRGYGLDRRVFSYFKHDMSACMLSRFGEELKTSIHPVPALYKGPYSIEAINECLNNLQTNGSVAVPGFMKPEGVVVYFPQTGVRLKKYCELFGKDYNDKI